MRPVTLFALGMLMNIALVCGVIYGVNYVLEAGGGVEQILIDTGKAGKRIIDEVQEG
jgi:hypothetical protein